MFGNAKQNKALLKHSPLVFGIVAVVCLELGFTTFISTSDLTQRSTLIVNNADGSIGPVPIAESINTATLHPEDFVEFPRADDTIPKRAVTDQFVRKVSHRVKTIAKPTHFAAIKKKQAPTKIKQTPPAETYAVDRKPSNDPQKEGSLTSYRSYEVTVAEASLKPKSEKRSLLAGALPIVKKPYSWIKALGSKIF